MIRCAPNRLIKCPVKKDGRYMPRICADMTIGTSSVGKPHCSIANGDTVIRNDITT